MKVEGQDGVRGVCTDLEVQVQGGVSCIPRRPAVVNRLQQRQPANEQHRQQRQMLRRIGIFQWIAPRIGGAGQVLWIDRAATGTTLPITWYDCS
jgi:hypothetical protein